MTSRKYPIADIKILYGLAAGRCAFPDCRREVIIESTDADESKQIGKIAHIVGHSDGGPRGDPDYPREELDTYKNWVLLCPTCHDTFDAQDNTYTVDFLLKLKADHECWVRTSLASEILGVGFAELEVVAKAIIAATAPISADFSVTPPQAKMERNGLTKPVHMLITMGLSKSKEVYSFVQHVAEMDVDFPERLKAGFVAEYNRLLSTGLMGDALFEAMHEFSSGGSQDFKRQAAGLAVLSHLFEACEVFEK